MSQLRLVFDTNTQPILLESIGHYFRPSDLGLCLDDTFDLDKVYYLDEITNYEWWYGLSNDDKDILKKYFNVDEYLLRSFGTSDISKYIEEVLERDDGVPYPDWYLDWMVGPPPTTWVRLGTTGDR